MPVETADNAITIKKKDGSVKTIPIGRKLTAEEIAERGITKDLRPNAGPEGEAAAYYSSAFDGPAQQPPQAKTGKIEESDEAAIDASAVDLQELIGGKSDFPLETRVVTLKGQRLNFCIKRLSLRERNQLEGKKWRRNGNGQLEQLGPDVMETLMMGHTLHSCVVKPDGTPYFTVEQLLGRPEKKDKKGSVTQTHVLGLVETADAEVEQFLYDLRDAVYEVNPKLNPFEMLSQMGLLPTGDPSSESSSDG